MVSNWDAEKQGMEEQCSGSLTDAGSHAVGGESLGEFRIGGAVEGDTDTVNRGGCRHWGGCG